MNAEDFIWLLVSYGIGCFNTGYYYVKWKFKSDIRDSGSRATGATNVGRTAGKKGFLITAGGDILKGALAVALGKYVLEISDIAVLGSLIAVVLGHIFPIQLGFKGGKGIATLAGALLAYNPFLMLVVLLLFAVFFVIIRKKTPAALIVLALLPVFMSVYRYPLREIGAIALINLIVIFANRDNLRRVLKQPKEN